MKELKTLCIFIIFIAFLAAIFIHFNHFFSTLESFTFDKRLQLTTDKGMFNKLYDSASSDIIIINLDDIDYF